MHATDGRGTAMVCLYEWYATSSPKSENPPTRRAAVFHAIENCYISELISVGVARRLRSVLLA
ncbi:hypothetical protein [Nostoc sp.]|uniref:hypothetical protein n=1 Tax=Nostoc sp. TaxID=1180 RepID=UPI002FF5ECE1